MLRVVGQRADGYHFLQTVFQFIDKSDWITLNAREDGVISLLKPLEGVPEASDLTVRAAKLLQSHCGCHQRGVTIEVEKNLPMGGGIGGGSSDAATVLLGLNKLWDCGLSVDVLAQLGLSLGADVPVFIRGFSAWAEGVGEHLEALPDLAEPWYVVLIPPCHVSTAEVFCSKELTRDNKSIKIADFVAGQQENHCLPVVSKLYQPVKEALNALSEFSPDAKLTGTGACVFAAFDDQSMAESAAEKLAEHWQVFVAKGMNISPLHIALDSIELSK